MKIRMLTTEYDNETNEKVWNKGDILTVDEIKSRPPTYYIITRHNGMDRGISCDSEGKYFEVVEE